MSESKKEWGKTNFETFETFKGGDVFVRIKDVLKMLNIIIEEKGDETVEIAVFCVLIMWIFTDLEKGHKK